MKAGDWVTTYQSKWNRATRETDVVVKSTERIKSRTPKQLTLEQTYGTFKATQDPLIFSAQLGYYDPTTYLRPSTPEEIAQGASLEREAAEKAQQKRDAANAIRMTLPGLDWSAINDATVERIDEMVRNPANRVKPVQVTIGKGKR